VIGAHVLQFPPTAATPGSSDAWSDAAVERALADGHPVLVDFTADWCITCKVNERTVLASAEVRRALRDSHAVVLRADWTRRDEPIRRILAAHGKAGVPMYLVYRPSQPQAPEVLPELITPGIVVDALRRAGESP
jgi:thiol:disulfide interchange protein DsbD